MRLDGIAITVLGTWICFTIGYSVNFKFKNEGIMDDTWIFLYIYDIGFPREDNLKIPLKVVFLNKPLN